jgi:hypothetical protein
MMTEENNSADYKVGYKHPPRHTQFKRGESGNRKGRPKKNATLEEALTKELLATISVPQDGRRRRLSVLAVILKLYIRAAAKGDIKAAAMVLNMFRSQKQTETDNLAELLQQFRGRNARLASDQGCGATEI